ncbi:MAG: hypothetical protein Q7U77_11370 [Sediminibacterium sp.]|uniref:hypothetical protein n=1 Tax=Sediminibacterium sp. TaxID=1917865 RepID=UPI00271A9F35|nr:hypothetical protein [Sediminibacterium sp.]MDO8997217.1 hypothetical protein [Sediminibacterium sp.]
MNQKLTDLPISIKSLADCDQEQLNSIAHLIETKYVSFNSNPAGFILIAKDQDTPFCTINDLANYYQKQTGQSLKMGRYLVTDCQQIAR